MGFLGVAGIAIIAVYVFAQGRRGRQKERAEAERLAAIEAKPAASESTDPVTTAERTGTSAE